ncbi:amino acid ABC transporter substrate-binding protein [Chitinimonas prasina]|uniref:Amino acid ABC transporter substrate-binding protein n=1 Tax=Chitinimonas prasina TaxID=1434937 RepID=A0ABQ5YIW4_9NEIS|nr:transporter substrate-binding domain-containing protein [Chitinimonas prasina]GLR13923.1 amino acid ABC transporter substrate-binding protein [Chitinimonas prasina]
MLLRALLILLACLPLAAEPLKLRLVTDDWPPYEYAAKGKADGYSVARLEAVLRQMEVELVHPDRAVPWKRLLAMLEAGEADVAVNGGKVDNREAYVHFSAEPFTETRWTAFSRRSDGLRLQKKEDFKGLRAGLVHGWSYSPEIEAFLGSQGKSVVSYDQFSNFRRLLAGQVDYVIEERQVGLHLAAKQGWGEQLVTADVMNQPIRFYVMFSRKTVAPEWVARFDAAFKAFRGSAEDRALRKRYGLESLP